MSAQSQPPPPRPPPPPPPQRIPNAVAVLPPEIPFEPGAGYVAKDPSTSACVNGSLCRGLGSDGKPPARGWMVSRSGWCSECNAHSWVDPGFGEYKAPRGERY
jgi:hypothetical protein